MIPGLPGAGIGGLFYLISALAMPVHAGVSAVRRSWIRRRAASDAVIASEERQDWRLIWTQFAIAAAIIAGVWATGWALAVLLVSHPETLGRLADAETRSEIPNVLKAGALLTSAGTLAGVMLSVQIARLLLSFEFRSRKAFAAFLIAMLMLACAATAAAQGTQSPERAATAETRDARALVLAADSAYAQGRTADAKLLYEAALAHDEENSRAIFRLGQLSASNADSLRLFERYVRLEPGDAWGHMALAEALAAAGRREDAIREQEAAVRLAPGDADAVAQLASMRGDDPPAVAARRVTGSPAADLVFSGSTDSEDNTSMGFAAGASIATGAAARAAFQAGRRSVRDILDRILVQNAVLTFTARPRREFRLEASGGIAAASGNFTELTAIPDSDGPTPVPDPDLPGRGRGRGRGSGKGPGGAVVAGGLAAEAAVDTVLAQLTETVPIGSLRARWQGPRASLDARVSRALLDATPLLLINRVIRNEAALRADIPILGPVKLRGGARGAAYEAIEGNNQRMMLLGGLAMPASRAVEVSATVQRLSFSDSAHTYFAPRLAHIAELGSYTEIEMRNGGVVAFDVGAGMQRLAEHGGVMSEWKPSFRLWSQLVAPIAAGSEFRLEIDTYDSRLAEAANASSWRYGSVTAALRIALR